MLKIILRDKRLEKFKAFKLNIDERLYKKAKINVKENFFLPLISKVMEKFIYNQTRLFLDKNKILYKYKSGFRKSFLQTLA